MADLKQGDYVTWLHQPRGGYGYILRVPGVVKKVGRVKAQIEVAMTTGLMATRWVKNESLERLEQNNG